MSRPEAQYAAHFPVRGGWPALLALFFGAALPSVALCIWLFEAAGATPLALSTAPQQQTRPEAFSHTKHVNQEWWKFAAAGDMHRSMTPELAQDCRGCHDYSRGEHDSSLSVDLCQRCHFAGPREFEVRLVETERPGSGFPHSKHLALECRTCHGPDATSPALVPAVLPTPDAAGIEYCRSCHVAEAPRTYFFGIEARGQEESTKALRTPDEMSRKLVARIDRQEVDRLAAPFQPEGGPTGDRVLGRFRHSTHLTPAQLAPGADSSACATCHPRLDQGTHSNLAAVPFDAAACASCHGPKVRFEPRTVGRRSLTAGTFPHHRHVGVNHAGSELTCTACHQFDGGAGGTDRFGLGPSWAGDAYASCVQCHTDREVSGHGGSWNCAECHGVQSLDQLHGFSLGAARPRVDVLRPEPGQFHFEQHGHRDLGSDSSCADCHRAEPGAGASGVVGRPFEHSTHLAPDALLTLARWNTASHAERAAVHNHCARCHADVASLAGPADWSAAQQNAALFHPTRDGVFAAAECASCHGREPQIAAAELRPAARLVFSHRDHVGRTLPGQGELTCLDCHLPTTGDNLRFALAPGVSDCTDCHGHAADAKVPRPLGFTVAEGQACQSCHSAGIPSDSRPVEVGRQVVARQVGTLSHPTDPAEDCSRCHKSGSFAITDTVVRRRTERAADRVWTTTRTDLGPRSPHAAPYAEERKRLVPDNLDNYFQEKPEVDRGVACMHCHWADNNKQTGLRDRYKLGHDLEMRRTQGRPLLEGWTAGFTLKGQAPSANER